MKCANIMKICVIFSFICVLSTFAFLLHCPDATFAGVNDNQASLSGTLNFARQCNQDCACSRLQYDPVCGTDNVIYYSPCFAGCKNSHSYGKSKAYSNCRCISGAGEIVDINGVNVTIHARREKCKNNCTHLYFFLSIIFFCLVFTFLVSMPSLAATLRCVAETQKSFALGVQWIGVRLIGTIPAPILFGCLIDLSCSLWQSSCSKKGACLFYNNKEMSKNMLLITTLLKALSCAFFFMAWILYKPPVNVKTKENGVIPASDSQTSTESSLSARQVPSNGGPPTTNKIHQQKVWSTDDDTLA